VATHIAEEPFRHEAFLYAGLDDFAAAMAAFIREGVERREPALVVVGREKLDVLRDTLGAAGDRVLFADMADVGANPARIIPAWRDFVSTYARPGRALRGVGEPIHPEREPAELVECHRHEALLNLAFADTPAFRLVCPYDTEALDPAVIEHARTTHPAVVERGVPRPSGSFEGLESVAAPFADPLPPPPADAERLDVTFDGLPALRRLVQDRGERAGLSPERTVDLVQALQEVAANSLRHGGGRGVLFVWEEPDSVVCEVRDAGRIINPLAGRERPHGEQSGGWGLWLANQLCDLVQVRALDAGGVVRLHMRRARRGGPESR
jgi:anti-sigma regulatory factor (Ser/Thr protein kinase)